MKGAQEEAVQELEVVKGELEEVKEAHEGTVRELQEAKWDHKELKEELEELRGQVGYEIVLRVRHSVLTGREPFHSTSVYSEAMTAQGHTVCVLVDMDDPQHREHYGFHLAVLDGPFPCKATYTVDLVHYDGNPLSAVKYEGESTFAEADSRGLALFIHKARLASPYSPYVKDGYVTFKCAFKIVNL